MDKIELAKQLAEKLHTQERRLSGKSYYNHVLDTYRKLKQSGVQDEKVLTASILHHALDKISNQENYVKENFGEDILDIIKGYKRLSDIKIRRDPSGKFNEKYIVQCYLNLAKDTRVLLVRAADKVVNLDSAYPLSREKRIEIAEKALNIYSPICRLLGLMYLSKELENKAFKILYPGEYHQIETVIKRNSKKMEKFFKETKKALKDLLEESGIDAKITGRIKHTYSIYKKAIKHVDAGKDLGKDFENILDIAAMRIIVNTVEECYNTEDILKHLWKEIPRERDDYIQKPRPSGYQALHNIFQTRLFNLEIQIRTKEMHELAELGPASHIFYKIGNKFKKNLDKNPNWLKELNYWREEGDERITHFGDMVYAFTPKGEIIKLPKGSTILDFAYGVHTKLGNSSTGALVNGQIRKLNCEVKDGDTVEIMTSKSKKVASNDWLEVVKTKRAKQAIRKSLHN